MTQNFYRNLSFRKWTATALVAGIAALGNPAMIACGGGSATSPEDQPEESYSFDETDMRVAIEGTYAGTNDGKPVSIKLEQDVGGPVTALRNRTPVADILRQAGRRSLQCGNRSFVKSAAACISSTTMSVRATVSSESLALRPGSIVGSFVVFGNNLEFGDLYFELPDQQSLRAEFKDGVLQKWELACGAGPLAIELTRVE